MVHTQIRASQEGGDGGSGDGGSGDGGSGDDGSDDSGSGDGLSTAASRPLDSIFFTALVAIGSLQLVSCSLSALMHVMRYSVVAQLKLWKRLTGLEYREVLMRARSSRSFMVAFVVKSGFYLVSGIGNGKHGTCRVRRWPGNTSPNLNHDHILDPLPRPQLTADE